MRGGVIFENNSQTTYIDTCLQSLKVNQKIIYTETKVLLPCNGDKNALKLYFNFFFSILELLNTGKKQINRMIDI